MLAESSCEMKGCLSVRVLDIDTGANLHETSDEARVTTRHCEVERCALELVEHSDAVGSSPCLAQQECKSVKVATSSSEVHRGDVAVGRGDGLEWIRVVVVVGKQRLELRLLAADRKEMVLAPLSNLLLDGDLDQVLSDGSMASSQRHVDGRSVCVVQTVNQLLVTIHYQVEAGLVAVVCSEVQRCHSLGVGGARVCAVLEELFDSQEIAAIHCHVEGSTATLLLVGPVHVHAQLHPRDSRTPVARNDSRVESLGLLYLV
mmetsp:Transcript_18159/g.70200  ORF Transcript_18159/g.70200 Transcript_18159/m.70200 type:complete len:260 (-) Transcript_18159:715-1494(-)